MSECKEIKITPYDATWEVACKIINAEYETTDIFNRTYTRPFFDIPELLKIGEHIVNYCKTEGVEE